MLSVHSDWLARRFFIGKQRASTDACESQQLKAVLSLLLWLYEIRCIHLSTKRDWANPDQDKWIWYGNHKIAAHLSSIWVRVINDSLNTFESLALVFANLLYWQTNCNGASEKVNPSEQEILVLNDSRLLNY